MVIQKKQWEEQNYYFKMRDHHPICFSKESSFQEVASLPSFDKNCDSVASHYGVTYFEFKYKALRDKNIVSY